MTNTMYREKVANSIKYVLEEAEQASKVRHAGMSGRIREMLASRLLKPLLPPDFDIGTGKITDRCGCLTKEIDLVIYARRVLPPITYEERSTVGVFPVEACYYAMEVKSRATARGVKDAVEKAQTVLGLHYPKPQDEPKNLGLVVPTLFAFGSDLSEKSSRSELDRYAKYDSEWNIDPILRVLCVVGRGYWYFRKDDQRWVFHAPSKSHEEVIGFLAGVVNTLLLASVTPRQTFLGFYLMSE